MNRFRWLIASLRYSWRRQLGLLLGMTIATAVLVGALAVGDSVRGSLRALALARIGDVDGVLNGGDRFFRSDLASRVAAVSDIRAASIIALDGVAATSDGTHRAHDVHVLGVDAGFYDLAPAATTAARRGSGLLPGRREVFLNERLARQLDASVGTEIVVRVEKPSVMPSGAPLADEADNSVAMRLTVTEIVGPSRFGDFGLRASQIPPLNMFVSREMLAAELDQTARANAILAANNDPSVPRDASQNGLRPSLTLDDLELRVEAEQSTVELRSSRVFIDEAVDASIRAADVPGLAIFTYFVNELRHKDRATPYSTVAGLGWIGTSKLGDADRALLDPSSIGAEEIGPDEMVISRWLADDLHVAIGDSIDLRYFVLGPNLQLSEASRSFRVARVVDVAGLAADPTLLPDFPGLADSENCRDWEPGIPIDLDRIRDIDEKYWDDHGGAPKAFISLAAARELWGGVFGSLTQIRVATDEQDRLEQAAVDVDPARVGLSFRDERTPALAASQSATDFGGLFLGLSFFLIGSAVMLTTLLFTFGVEQRRREVGSLLAVGFYPGQVRAMFLAEAALVASVGGLVGAPIGVAYTGLILRGLDTLWSDAVAAATLHLHVTPVSVVGGIVGGIVVALIAIFFAVRKQVGRPAAELLSARDLAMDVPSSGTSWGAKGLVGVGVVAPLAIYLSVDPSGGPAASGAYFGGGALLLVGGLAACQLFLRATGTPRSKPLLSLSALGVANSRRRAGRSLATIALLASGTFLVVAVGVNELGPPRDATDRRSGTGGFLLFGSASLPVHHNLSEKEGLDAFGLVPDDLHGATIVPLRRLDGDEASCLNLSLTTRPQLFGVDRDELAERGAFTFNATLEATDDPWRLLDRRDDAGTIAAIGDAASVTWALHKKVGDTLEYVDERGERFDVQIVGTVANSILQGMLLIGEGDFRQRFPSESGFRGFLIDGCAADDAEGVAENLTRGLTDVGLEVVATSRRLAELNGVQNTYLAIFQLLGGLGVLLGTLGLGLVVLRNVLERRGEFAVFRAVGYRMADIRWLVLVEHGALVALGLGVGVVAALVAVIPGGRSSVSATPAALVGGITLSAVIWVWAFTHLASRGELTDALRGD